MITPEMYQNAKDEIERLRQQVARAKHIGNNLLIENAAQASEIERLKAMICTLWKSGAGIRLEELERIR